ncbi:MAG: hypothetical protein OXU45_02950 [Candidatus Melainabacteria bacterium]|nr:hypothetical protein [Candidatus Melainabacteria bacterium]
MSRVPEGIQSQLASFFGVQREQEVKSAAAKRKVAADGPLKKLNSTPVSRHAGVGQVFAMSDTGKKELHATRSDARADGFRSAIMKSLRV